MTSKNKIIEDYLRGLHSCLDETSLFHKYPKREEADIINYLDQNAMEMAVIVPIAPYDRNETVQKLCRKYPERLIGYCSIHPTFFHLGNEAAPQIQLRRLIIIENRI